MLLATAFVRRGKVAVEHELAVVVAIRDAHVDPTEDCTFGTAAPELAEAEEVAVKLNGLLAAADEKADGAHFGKQCLMARRMVELKRVLKPAGSIYLHCDPTASHYLKFLLDSVFGPANFHNEAGGPSFAARKGWVFSG